MPYTVPKENIEGKQAQRNDAKNTTLRIRTMDRW